MYTKAFQAVPKGWELFKHAVSMVSDNLMPAIRISLPWIVLCAVLVGVGAFVFANMMVAGAPFIQVLGTLGIVMVIVALIVIGSIIAIEWHRYILLDEMPRGYFQGWKKLNYRAYTMQMLKITFFLIVISYFGAVVIVLVTPEATQFLVPVMMGVVLSFVFLRMSIGFAGIALGKRGINPGASWRLSKRFRGVLFVNAVLLTLLNALPEFLRGVLSGPTFLSFIPILLSLAILWFSMMVGVSLLTTLYGHYIEERPI